jgi:hypothetical protein
MARRIPAAGRPQRICAGPHRDGDHRLAQRPRHGAGAALRGGVSSPRCAAGSAPRDRLAVESRSRRPSLGTQFERAFARASCHSAQHNEQRPYRRIGAVLDELRTRRISGPAVPGTLCRMTPLCGIAIQTGLSGGSRLCMRLTACSGSRGAGGRPVGGRRRQWTHCGGPLGQPPGGEWPPM